jgi:hypothetical protein
VTTPAVRVQRLREETAKATAEYEPFWWSGPWNPQAAEKALDLLRHVFAFHEGRVLTGRCGACDAPWPCGEYTAALSLLDTLDPEGAEHA